MEENNINEILLEKLEKLNELEIKKTKVLTAIFQKTTKEIVERKVQSLESNFEDQAKFYDQNLNDYKQIYDSIIPKYKEQLLKIIEKYNSLYINMQLELQEAECNQKIAITNLKKSFDIKQEIIEKNQMQLLEKYNRKVDACIQKKRNYDIIINECEKEINASFLKINDKINSLFADKSSQISLKDESAFLRFINKIKNKFTGEAKFKTYVLEPINIELDMMDQKLPDVVENIKQDTIKFVAKIKQAKEDTNTMFENTVNG